MKDFYSKQEAASILGVSTFTITKYIQKSKLRTVKKANKALIPCEDVHYMYDNLQKPTIPSRDEMDRLEKMIVSLREEVNVLKIGLGYGAPTAHRTDDQLLLMRQEILKDLSKSSWPSATIYKLSDTMLSLSEKEISRMVSLRGASGWRPLFDIVERMHKYVKSVDTYPLNGLGTLEARLIGAKNRVYGLIYVATKIDNGLPEFQAKQLEKAAKGIPPIDDFISSYLKDRQTVGEIEEATVFPNRQPPRQT
jgi:hypothetical protein